MKIQAVTYQSTFDRWIAQKRRVAREGVEYTEILKRLIKHGVPCHIVDNTSAPVYKVLLDRSGELVKKKL